MILMFPVSIKQTEFDFYSANKDESKKDTMVLSADDQIQLHAKRISSYLCLSMAQSVNVVLTNNRATMISSSRKKGVLFVRLHLMFAEADERVLGALCMFLSKMPMVGAKNVLDEFIAENRQKIAEKNIEQTFKTYNSSGDFYELSDVLKRVSENYFNNSIEGVSIVWGKKRPKIKKRRRASKVSRVLASYNFYDKTIRVNPVLDSKRVPSFIIDWIVYHELLHHVVPAEKQGGKTSYHNKRFRLLERAFPNYDEIVKWEKENLDWLLRG